MADQIDKDLKAKGLVRTDMHCHDCSKTFVATIDFDIDGNHQIICPYCGHIHYRKIKAGQVTSDRWSSGDTNVATQTERIWNHQSLRMKTSAAAQHIRDKWLKPQKET